MAVSEPPGHTSLVLRTGRRAALKPPSFPSLLEGFSPPVQESGWRGRVRDSLWFSARLYCKAAATPRVNSHSIPSSTQRAFSLSKEGEKTEFVLPFISHSGTLLQSATNTSRVSNNQEGAKMFPCPQAMPSCLRSAYFDINIPVTWGRRFWPLLTQNPKDVPSRTDRIHTGCLVGS